MAIRITCINKAGGYHEEPHEAISHLGWVMDGSAEKGRSTRLQMYDWLSVRGNSAYVQVGTVKVDVITAVTSRGTKYVKTRPDFTPKDNLLKLPECPT